MREWNYAFSVPEQKKVRVLVHTDCKNEADDQYALAHHVMTPKFIVKGVIASHFNKHPREYGDGYTAQASFDEVNKVLEYMGVDDIPVVKGAEHPLKNETEPQISEGAQMIIDEAMRDDSHPLFIACQGALTDLASAILMEPAICGRMTAIWIGGGDYPEGGPEFNLEQDIAAANILMKSKMDVWQVTKSVYKQMAVSLAELQYNVMPCGKIGRYLFEQMLHVNHECAGIPWPNGEIWGLGDSPTISLLLEEEQRTDSYDIVKAPVIDYKTMQYCHREETKLIRVYKKVDARLTFQDFFAKLKLNYGETKDEY